MKTLISMLIGTFVFSFSAKSQIFNDGKVDYVMSVGGMEYAFLTNLANEEVYQTSPFAVGELKANQEVRLKYDDEQDQSPQVLASTLTSNLFAQLVGNGSIPPPPVDNMPVFDQATGVLVFNSRESASDYFEAFCEYIYDNEDDDSTNNLKLDYFESYYPGYLSHRTDLLSRTNLDVGDFTLEEINDAYNETFIHHEVAKTFTNSRRMVAVGDTIICKLTSEIEVEFARHDFESLTYIETLLDLTDEEIVIKALIGQPKLTMTASTATISQAKGEFIEPNGTWKIETGFAVQDVTCEPMKQKLIIELTEFTWNDTYQTWDNAGTWLSNNPVTTGIGPFVLNIDWGDGTSSTIPNWFPGNSITKTYSNPGTYQVTTFIDIPEIPTVNGLLVDPTPIEDGSGFSDEIVATASTTTNTCLVADRIQAGGEVIQGEWMMKTSIWTGR